MKLTSLVACAGLLAFGCTDPKSKEANGSASPLDTSTASLVIAAKSLLEQGFVDSAAAVIQAMHHSDSAAFAVHPDKTTWKRWHQHMVVDLADALIGTGPVRARAVAKTVGEAGNRHAFVEPRTLSDADLLESRIAARLGDGAGSLVAAQAAFDRLVAQSDTTNKTAAWALNMISKSALDEGRLDEALALMYRAVAIARMTGNTEDACGFLSRRSQQVRKLNFDLAIALNDSSISIARHMKDTLAICTAYNGKGVAYLGAANLDSAIVQWEKGIDLHKQWRTPRGDVLPFMCTNLAQVAFERGLFLLGDKALQDALSQKDLSPLSLAGRLRLITAKGVREGSIGNNREFLAYAREALRLAREARMDLSNAGAYLTLVTPLSAALHKNLLHQESLDLIRSVIGKPEFQGRAMEPTRLGLMDNQAVALNFLGRPEEALIILDSLTRTTNRWHPLGNMADSYQLLKRWDSSDSCRLLQLAEMPGSAMDGAANRSGIYTGLAENALDQEKWNMAVDLADSALLQFVDTAGTGSGALVRSPDHRPALEIKATGLFEIARKQGVEDPSFHECLRTDSLLRVLCDRALVPLRDPLNRSVILGTSSKSANRTIHLLRMLLEGRNEPGRLEEMLGLIDYSRDRQSKLVNAISTAAITWGLPAELAKSERDLTGILAEQAELSATMEGGKPKTELDQEIILLTDSLRAVRSQIMRLAPAYYKDLGLPVAIDLPKVQKALGSAPSFLLVQHLDQVDSTLLNIGVFRDTLMLAHAAVSPVALDKLRSELRGAVGSSAEDPGVQRQSLFASIVQPFMVAREVEMMLVVPDQAMAGIPFEALVAAETASAPSITTFLGDQLVVRYGSSIHQFLVDEQVARSNDRSYTGFAPQYPSSEAPSLTAMRGSSDVLRNLQPLNETDDEVEAAERALTGRTFIGSDASEANFNEAAPDAGLIHLAMHSIIDPVVPLNSVLVFEKPALDQMTSDSVALDGLLHFHELIGMRLHAELAVLSACETGVGLYKTGEGVMSMSRAFNYAGVPNVISSLWKVDDRATKEIMVKFYEKLAEGLGKADALAEAKRWYRKENPNAPPSHWAAFILIGDNEPVHLKKRSPVRPWMIGGGAIAAVVAAMAARRRRQRAQAA